MKFFTNLSVRKKLVVTFSIICIFIVLIGVNGVSNCLKINSNAKEMYEDNLITIKNLEEIKANINEVRAIMNRICL